MAACFSLQWLEQMLIWFLIVCFVVAVVKLLVSIIAGWFGPSPGTGTVLTILGWLIGLLIAIWLIVIVFDLIACMFGGPGLGVGFPLRGVR